MHGQWLNVDALRSLRAVLRSPGLLRPSHVVRTVQDLGFEDWRRLSSAFGVNFVVFDKDNTLTAPYANCIHPKVKRSLEQCIDVFGTERIAIVSNSAGTLDDTELRAKHEIENETGLHVVIHRQKKPLGFDAVLEHFSKTRPDGAFPPSRQILVVGDRLFTDILFGNLAGAQTMYCREILDARGDNPFARIIRFLEQKVIYPAQS